MTMNQINNKLALILLIFISIATGYLSFQKYIDLHFGSQLNFDKIDKKKYIFWAIFYY